MSRARDWPSPNWFPLFIFAFLAASPFAAQAVDVGVKLEPGAGLSMGRPQSQRFELGGAATVKGLFGFERGYVNLEAGLTFLGLAAEQGFTSSTVGTAWAPSLGLRIQLPRESEQMRLSRPHERESYYGAKPWADADMMYVRTGGLDRVGFAGAVGLSYPVGEARSFWFGPFVRYFQIVQSNRAGYDNRDARTIILGVSLETGTRIVRQTLPEPEKAPVVMAAAPLAAAARADRDGDGVPDDVDACPDMQGPASNSGCPVYEKLIVKPDKLELREKIQFAWNNAVIDPVSYPALDETAKALQDNRGFRVAIQGHSSSEGADDHNQSLSSDRAEAVLEYIANRGVARDRLVSQGFSSSQPIKSNATELGREANRRVEFIVHFIILKEWSAQ
jgi:outer membrane protein OmpA-like peptidoglycan-associated protein